jgi:Family of unknown function (DUF6152)
VKLRAAAACLALALAVPAFAHHSFAMFDSDHQVRLHGEVTEFIWQNPHVYLHMKAPDAKGKVREWTIECANPGILNRTGWKFNMIKKGDQISPAAHRRARRPAEAGQARRRPQVRQWRASWPGHHPD